LETSDETPAQNSPDVGSTSAFAQELRASKKAVRDFIKNHGIEATN
jgi:hypothetical protein